MKRRIARPFGWTSCFHRRCNARPPAQTSVSFMALRRPLRDRIAPALCSTAAWRACETGAATDARHATPGGNALAIIAVPPHSLLGKMEFNRNGCTDMAVEVAVIGTGWCGGIRSETLARSALVSKLHVCEIRPDRLEEVHRLTNAATVTLDYRDIVKNPDIVAVYICTTPE